MDKIGRYLIFMLTKVRFFLSKIFMWKLETVCINNLNFCVVIITKLA